MQYAGVANRVEGRSSAIRGFAAPPMRRLMIATRQLIGFRVSLLLLAPPGAAAQTSTAPATATSPAAARDSFTVAECVRIARLTAFDVQAAEAEHLAAHFDSAAAARNVRPAFAVSGGATVAP